MGNMVRLYLIHEKSIKTVKTNKGKKIEHKYLLSAVFCFVNAFVDLNVFTSMVLMKSVQKPTKNRYTKTNEFFFVSINTFATNVGDTKYQDIAFG